MKKLFTESEIIALYKSGVKNVPVAKGDIITPLGRDKVKSLGMAFSASAETDSVNNSISDTVINNVTKSVSLASDHTGFAVKKILGKILSEKGFTVEDVGTHNEESCDYPDFAVAAAKNVQCGRSDFAVIIDATGIPSAITANKLKGIRAATCYNEFSAKSAREHNNANVLVVGAKALGEETIKSILETWLKTSFAGGRHQKRLDKIAGLEK